MSPRWQACPQCCGYDPHCAHCTARRLARKHGQESEAGNETQSDADAWYAAEVERMKERAPA